MGRRKTQEPKIKLGGQWIDLKPLSPENGVRLCLLLGPYIPKFRRVFKILEKDLDEDIAVVRLRQIAETMVDAPGHLVQMVGLLVDRDPRWVATNVNALEIVRIVPELLRYHRILELVVLGEALGLLSLRESSDG